MFHKGISSSLIFRRHTHISSFSLSDIEHGLLVDFFHHLLQRAKTLRHCQQVHGQVLLTGSDNSAFLASRLVSHYARFGLLGDAQTVFETTPVCCISNSLLWNSYLRAIFSRGKHQDTLKIYCRMRNLGVAADGYTFPLVLRACGEMGVPNLCRFVHCHVLHGGLFHNIHVANELIGMYGKLSLMEDARKVFDRMLLRSHISWNTLISGYSTNYDCVGALGIFQLMEIQGVKPNVVTWTALLSSHARCKRYLETLRFYCEMRKTGIQTNAETLAVVISVCVDSGAVDKGEIIHGYVIKGGFVDYSFVNNSLICLYGRNGDTKTARGLFLETKHKKIETWNAMISSYAESGFCEEALAVFKELEMSDQEFPNVVSWTAVINGYVSNGRGEEALDLFRKMQHARVGVVANSVTISSLLSACADFSALRAGKEIHGHLVRAVMDCSTSLVGNGLINMYAKCGSLKESDYVFKRIECKDTISWNSMIAGYGSHGRGEIALYMFSKMIECGFEPDKVTFVAVLSACSHSGLVAEGLEKFDLMMREYDIAPGIEHYSCVVDLLGRAGLLQQANEFVRSMPIEPNEHIWSSLLLSCTRYKDVDVAVEGEVVSWVSSTSLGYESTPGNYMLLSNMYAANGRWEDSAKVRVSAKLKGLKKVPGWSSIEVEKQVYTFTAGNSLATGMNEVLKSLACHMKKKKKKTEEEGQQNMQVHIYPR
ncbi:putative pentatricopeptide repeat-containing protein At1g17630 [Impatiens glandulifera]|uniref:putative pentatricopeptide repeat-containing protein At1g17630 n=1 Tax=Impatiens glandulifera TaxID=253017 RepID=UPI001FB0D150|nr:putative pentatricopeptide repeat-containing protein At1g17630 [Impatiens glandulifera]